MGTLLEMFRVLLSGRDMGQIETSFRIEIGGICTISRKSGKMRPYRKGDYPVGVATRDIKKGELIRFGPAGPGMDVITSWGVNYESY